MGWRSWRDQRRAMKLAFPLSLRSVRRYRRAHGIPDLPGIWHTPRRFYGMAQESVMEHDDGWSVTTADPGHKFIAWEMAVRYEAASSEARLHYTQLCDGPTEEEYQERVRRIMTCLAEMSRLSELERAIKPVIPAGPEAIRSLARCPRPRFEEPPPEPRLEGLAKEHIADVVPTLHKVIALQKQRAPFQPEVLSLLLQADEMIPGAGMHHSVLHSARQLRLSLRRRVRSRAAPPALRAVRTGSGLSSGDISPLCGPDRWRPPRGMHEDRLRQEVPQQTARHPSPVHRGPETTWRCCARTHDRISPRSE